MILEERIRDTLERIADHVDTRPPSLPTGNMVPVGTAGDRRRRWPAVLLVAAAVIVAVVAAVAPRGGRDDRPVTPAQRAAREWSAIELGQLWPAGPRDGVDVSHPTLVASAFAEQVLHIDTPTVSDLVHIGDDVAVAVGSPDGSVELRLSEMPDGWFVRSVGAAPMPQFSRHLGGEITLLPPAGTAAVVMTVDASLGRTQRALTTDELATHRVWIDDAVTAYLFIYLDEAGNPIGAHGNTLDGTPQPPASTPPPEFTVVARTVTRAEYEAAIDLLQRCLEANGLVVGRSIIQPVDQIVLDFTVRPGADVADPDHVFRTCEADLRSITTGYLNQQFND
jgi:hypothetical protein